MLKLILLLSLLGGVTVSSERSGDQVSVTVATDTGHVSNVSVVTARGPENIAQTDADTFVFDSAFDAGYVKGQWCTDDFCEPFELSWAVAPTWAGFLSLTVIAFAAGVLMNFMPCVLPVLGLKLVAAAKGGGKLYYVLGVLASFAVLATAAVLLGTGLSHMSSPWFRVILALTCMLMGFHFLKFWHIPYFGLGRYASKTGSFALGVTTVALGSSCSVPFLAPILVYTSSNSWWETYVLFLTVGLGFSLPFILPIYKLLPKPGQWMIWLERTCGIALIMVAGWLAVTLAHAPLIGFLWLGFWTIILIIQKNPWRTNVISIILMLVVLWGIVALYNVALPPATVNVDFNKPGVVFVTADWCMNCPIAHSVVESDAVQAAIRELDGQYTELDWTNGDAPVTDFLGRFGVKAVPFALVINKEGKQTVLSGMFTTEQVLKALSTSPSPAEPQTKVPTK